MGWEILVVSNFRFYFGGGVKGVPHTSTKTRAPTFGGYTILARANEIPRLAELFRNAWSGLAPHLSKTITGG